MIFTLRTYTDTYKARPSMSKHHKIIQNAEQV